MLKAINENTIYIKKYMKNHIFFLIIHTGLLYFSFPDAEGCTKEECDYLRRNLLSCKIRVVTRPIKCWQVEVSQ